MKLPRKVTIGYRKYRVEELSKKQSDADEALGWHFNYPARIKVRLTELDPAEVANTFLHEILHGCWKVGELPKKKIDEEQVVTVLANQLTQVIRDNPEVIEFIVKNARA